MLCHRFETTGSHRSWLSEGVAAPPLRVRMEGEGGGMLLLEGALSMVGLAVRLCCFSMDCRCWPGIREARDPSSGLALDMDECPVVPVLKSSLLVAVLCTSRPSLYL